MKIREYLKPEYLPIRKQLDYELKNTLVYLQQAVLVYSKIQQNKDTSNTAQKTLRILTDNLFGKAIPVIKSQNFSNLGKVQNSDQIKMYPYGSDSIVKFVFTSESRTLHLYNEKSKQAISLTDHITGGITVTVTKFQLIHGINDLERNWKVKLAQKA